MLNALCTKMYWKIKQFAVNNKIRKQLTLTGDCVGIEEGEMSEG
jgi:hypothetical protein